MIPLGILAAADRPAASEPGGDTWNSIMAALAPWGWWRLDEAIAGPGVATDSSGNGRHGGYFDGGTQGPGLFGGSSVSQTTVAGRIGLPNYQLAATPKFTIGAMVKVGAVSGDDNQILSADSGTADRAWQFRATASGAVQFLTIFPAVTTTASTHIITDNIPHLVIVVFDQSLSAADGRVKIYVDGVLSAQSTTAITITTMAARPAISSRSNGANTGRWPGALDEGFIFDKAMSAAEIAALWGARNTA